MKPLLVLINADKHKGFKYLAYIDDIGLLYDYALHFKSNYIERPLTVNICCMLARV